MKNVNSGIFILPAEIKINHMYLRFHLMEVKMALLFFSDLNFCLFPRVYS